MSTTEPRTRPDSLASPDWQPSYSAWRHGGWYVDNLRYPSGAVGCVSRNFADRKWRAVCVPGEATYATRNEAAQAERAYVLGLWLAEAVES